MKDISCERKMTASLEWADFALSWLRHVCMQDAEHPVGCVNNVYFDTRSLTAFREKDHGDFLKTKVRLRWYRESYRVTGTAFLEMKKRIGLGRSKIRKTLKINPNWIDNVALESGELEGWLEQVGDELGYLFTRQLVPVTTTVYDRHRFRCPATGARVCLDTNIHSDRVNSRHLSWAKPVRIRTVVVEIKGSSAVDIPWLTELYRHGFRVASFSKYYECVAKSINVGDICE